MSKKTQPRPRKSRVAAPKDLPAGRRATNVKAGVKLRPTFVKSWSTSGDAD